MFLTFRFSTLFTITEPKIQLSVWSRCRPTSDLFSPSTGLPFRSSRWLWLIAAVTAACSVQLPLCWRLNQSAASLCLHCVCVRVSTSVFFISGFFLQGKCFQPRFLVKATIGKRRWRYILHFFLFFFYTNLRTKCRVKLPPTVATTVMFFHQLAMSH